MAKVSLRIYNREIESLVDQGHTDEAIAHCRHILKTFPKHLETYRMLGKAYLEARRYAEAVDIFSRVLMSVPDDFVSHVGMSIINDEQNRLDNSIWHMERAFEAQPSNAAIQGELQRLYARRDGMEPPKIRMTRGALAHMYVQGELYPQAIAEIRAVLAQDAQRIDMQVLLAKAFFKSNQKAEASDLCAQLLKKSAYCFDANRIMVELLPATAGAAESTQVYRMRVGELDPYATFAKESVFRVSEVADAAINLEKLEYSGQEVPIGQEWSSSLGIKLGDSGSAGSLTSSSAEPDWLKAANAPDINADIFAQPVENQTSQSNEEIPDFLRAAGWGESSGPEQPVSIFDTPDPLSNNNNDDLVSASIPDWLQGQMPVESAPPVQSAVPDVDWLNNLSAATQQNPQPASHGDMPDWLSGLGASVEDQPISPVSNAPDWLSGENSAPSNDSTMKSADVPDWLNRLGSAVEQPASQSSDAPDWLSAAGNETSNAASSDVPDWLAGLGTAESSAPAASQNNNAPDWLNGLADAVQPTEQSASNAPDWLSGFDEPASQSNEVAQPTVNIESLGASAQEQDDAVAWLESLAAKHGAKPEELVTDPNKRSETAPTWVQQASAANEAQAIPQPEPSLESLGASAQEQDDAVAWLESLAAKHGAKPEELVTDPNKRSEIAPTWVQQASAIGETQSEKLEVSENAKNIGEQFFAEFETASTATETANDETGMWLKDLNKKENQTEAPAPSGIPDWLSEKQPIAQTEKSDLPDWMDNNNQAKQEYISENLSQDDLSSWLSNLDDGAVKAEPQIDHPIMKDLPDWMNEIDSKNETQQDDWNKPVDEPLLDSQPASISPEPVSVTQTSALPDWLSNVDQSSKIEDDEDDTPPWLTRETWEAEEKTIEPTPITSSDWHPMESASKNPPKQEAKPVAASSQPDQQPVVAQAKAPKQQPAKKQPAEKKEPQPSTAGLNQAKGELDRGDIPAALEHYEKLIKKGKHLEETIRDLTDSLYRYPVEVGIWQTLGDAYMRANRLKEALESYNKAEELIR